jgi:hypothetical protein
LLTLGDFSHLPTWCKFIALMPQWDFLNFVVEQARAHSTLRLMLEAEVTGLRELNGRVCGLVAAMPDRSTANLAIQDASPRPTSSRRRWHPVGCRTRI